MSDEALKKLDEIHTEIQEIKKWIPNSDRVTNEQYCVLRTNSGANLSVSGLKKWFEKGCPREDSQHVSIKSVDEWARDNNTRKKKP
jgi:hypothetical protein